MLLVLIAQVKAIGELGDYTLCGMIKSHTVDIIFFSLNLGNMVVTCLANNACFHLSGIYGFGLREKKAQYLMTVRIFEGGGWKPTALLRWL